MTDNAFTPGLEPWLSRLGHLRNVVRQELVSRQLDRHLPPSDGGPLRVLDVGAGQGTQSLRLARLGHVVTAVEPDARMRSAFETAAAALAEEERERVTLLASDLAGLESVTHPAAYDLVLLHGVLMYLPDSAGALATLATRAAPGAIVSVAARNGDALAWRPASRHDWASALAMLDEQEAARAEGRDAFYDNEIGVRARADDIDRLLSGFEAAGLDVLAWYGVRIASDDVGVDTPAPDDEELATILEVEDRLGSTDPYRRLGTLVHVIGRRRRAGGVG